MPGIGNVGIRERAKKGARGGRTCISKGMEVTKVQDVLEKQQVVTFLRMEAAQGWY